MNHVINRRELDPISSRAAFNSPTVSEIPGGTQDAAPTGGAPRSDIGTIALHWGVAIAMVVSLATGLRIAADAPDAVISKALSPILPQGEIWTWHFLSSLGLFVGCTAYVLYMVRARLGQRVAPARLAALAMDAPARMRWNAINVLLHWAMYGIVAGLTATGVALYLGYGGWVVTVHSALAYVTLANIVLHVAGHFMYGGLGQLLRLFRATALPVATRLRQPLVVGLLAGVATGFVALVADFSTRDILHVPRVGEAPKLDGVLDDAVWTNARPVRVRTEQGANSGGSGESLVELRAVNDGRKIHFAVRWQDPTRSLARLPLVKRADGWRLLGTKADIADVTDWYEDKFAILFSHSDEHGNGGTTHMGPNPLPGLPKPLHARGYHYTTDDSVADVWQWKASRGGMLGYVDDMYFGPPNPPTDPMKAGKARYQAGYDSDPGKAFYVYNYKPEPPGGYRGPVGLLMLPKDLAATRRAMGRVPEDPDRDSTDEGSRWWMTADEMVPYSAEADAAIPVGTVIPGVLIQGEYSGDRAQIRGAAKWKDGWWTLEMSRDLETGSRMDMQFVKGPPIYAYVSAFDHNQTRHTRHMRPVVVRLD
ncbi:ethylbenzene dehydrogenase-related protein [Alsobacter sp. SYSU M60028]|uniref:Ethylbenzene dehydrogenase-related protein n=1 Tax=Alsobacter ponti TaxID=2962936 RepID=A0ABT1LGM9_9HYPH|nr:ethylbenzene dehydrogenase-related protein [Alsobacter ponti]MCP8940584.1 ethylbenzene dehydrogenase-related protein [Alsobacter ponti]